MRIFGLICILAGSLAGQQGQLTGPTSGLVFDWPHHSLRPILGIPGASTIGSPVNLGRDPVSAWVSPRLDSAIAVAADGSLHVYRIDAGSPSEQTLDGITGRVDAVAFSPSGTAAVLSSANGTHVITGLPGAPRVAGSVDLDATPRRGPPSALARRPTLSRVSIAVSDDGAYVLAGMRGSVRVLTISGESRKLMDVAANAVVAFVPGSQDAAIADSGAGVVLFGDLAGAASPKVLAASIPSPSGLAFSADGKRLFLASAKARSVTTYDVQSGGESTLACDCAPVTLVRMGNVFRLNDLSRGPLWLLDAGANDPRILFVPAAVD